MSLSVNFTLSIFSTNKDKDEENAMEVESVKKKIKWENTKRKIRCLFCSHIEQEILNKDIRERVQQRRYESLNINKRSLPNHWHLKVFLKWKNLNWNSSIVIRVKSIWNKSLHRLRLATSILLETESHYKKEEEHESMKGDDEAFCSTKLFVLIFFFFLLVDERAFETFLF